MNSFEINCNLAMKIIEIPYNKKSNENGLFFDLKISILKYRVIIF